MKAKNYLLSLCVYTMFISVAEAHNFGAHGAGLAAGLTHPIVGLDHLLAMIAVGIWAGQLGGRAIWLIPLTFVSVMSASASLASFGLALLLVEPAIACSVLILGLLIASSVRLPTSTAAVLVGLFALFHGYAHGLELPEATSPILYGIGFVATTALLQGLGIGFARSLGRYIMLQRIIGYTLIAASGLLLAAV